MLRLVSALLSLVLLIAVPNVGGAIELRGVASVNVTSDTSANAKNMAFDEARRQIISDTLRQYADVNTLGDAIKNAKASDLMNLIDASNIDGEKLSDTTYSANIAMTLNLDAARSWLNENGVQNWLPDATNQDVFTVVIQMSDALNDWAQLKQIGRAEKFDVGAKIVSGAVVTMELPTSVRGRFTIAVREGGWRYANKDGVLRIWK